MSAPTASPRPDLLDSDWTAARRTVPLHDRPAPAGPSHEADALERVVVRQALGRLAPRDRSLLFARYWADLTQDQLAQALDLPEGTAKVRLHRARAQLRRSFQTSEN